MVRQIFAAEINFEDTPAHVREKFNNTEKNIRRFLLSFKEKVAETYILGTRNRFTVYIVHGSLTPLQQFFHTEHNLKGYVQFYYNSGESITHLMATASGLLSPVKGDGKVLEDIRHCYQWATACGSLGLTLDHTLVKAMETARAVRTETGIDKFCASVVETGIELLYNRLEDVHSKNFLIAGTGKMARLALAYLTREGISNIAITGHDGARAQALAKKFGVTSFAMTSIQEYFLRADVIIGAAHEEMRIDLTAPLKEKEGVGADDEDKTRFILDLGIPPNFDARAVELYAAEFYHLDDLRRLQTSPLESFGGLEAAWRMVMKASSELAHLQQLLSQSPVLNAYLARQFWMKNGEPPRDKPRRTFRAIFFRKSEALGTQDDMDANTKVHVNNFMAENGREVVRQVTDLKKFRFYFSEN